MVNSAEFLIRLAGFNDPGYGVGLGILAANHNVVTGSMSGFEYKGVYPASFFNLVMPVASWNSLMKRGSKQDSRLLPAFARNRRVKGSFI